MKSLHPSLKPTQLSGHMAWQQRLQHEAVGKLRSLQRGVTLGIVNELKVSYLQQEDLAGEVEHQD